MPSLRVSYPAPIGGVRRDLNPLDMPPDCLVNASNLVFRKGRVQPRQGVASLGSDIGSPARGLIGYGIGSSAGGDVGGGTDALVAGCDNGWYKYSAGAWTALTGALSASDHFVFRIFPKSGTSYVVGINSTATAGGVDVPKKWDGAGAAISSVGGSPPKARAMMVLANRLMLFNLTAAGGYTGVASRVGYDVSAFNDFESGWSTTLNGLLIDTPGDIVAALEMGDLQGAIYKSDAVVMAVAQAGPSPFRFEWRSIGNVGPANPRCVVSVQDGSHIFLGYDGGLYRFDGVGVTSMGVHIQKLILAYANADITKLASTAWLTYDNTRNEILIFLKFGSLGASPVLMVSMANLSAWPLDYNGIASQSDQITAGGHVLVPGSTTGKQIVLISGATGKNWRENGVATDNGSGISVSWYHAMSDCGLPGQWKTLNSINSKFTTNDQDSFAAGSQAFLVGSGISNGGDAEGVAANESLTVAPNGGDGAAYVTDHRASGQFLSASYICSPNTHTWSFDGCDLIATARGAR